jgi:hypothetical protein
MTRHVKTNEEAIELAADVLNSLERMYEATDTEIEYTQDMIKQKRAKGHMTSVEEEFYRKKIDMFEENKPLIEADIEAVQCARENLTNPFKAWYDQDADKVEKLCKEQRLVIARRADQYRGYAGRFIHQYAGTVYWQGF